MEILQNAYSIVHLKQRGLRYIIVRDNAGAEAAVHVSGYGAGDEQSAI
jgi:hypothetical protein